MRRDLPFWFGSLVFTLTASCGARTDLLGPPDPNADASLDDGAHDALRDDGIPGFDIGFDAGREDVVTVFPDAPLRDTDPPPPTVCPGALPRSGAACAVTGECHFAGCDPKTPDRASCVGGLWVTSVSGCVTASDRCPVALPTFGSACAAPSGLTCYWDDCTIAGSIGSCVLGTWQVKRGGMPSGTCLPPEFWASHCPATLPASGSACPATDPGTGFGCTFRNACGLPEEAFCAKKKWDVGSSIDPGCAPAPGCPKVEPAPGAVVASGSPKRCAYPNSCGGVDLAESFGSTWSVYRPACPDTACPRTSELSSACTREGQACHYAVGAGCSLDCTCKGAAWGCSQTCGVIGGGGGK